MIWYDMIMIIFYYEYDMIIIIFYYQYNMFCSICFLPRKNRAPTHTLVGESSNM